MIEAARSAATRSEQSDRAIGKIRFFQSFATARPAGLMHDPESCRLFG
jgi:hypothetical protein